MSYVWSLHTTLALWIWKALVLNFSFFVFRLYYKQYLFHIIKQTENKQIFASLIFAHFHFKYTS